MKYRFKHWEDPSITSPERVININEDKQIIAYYEEVTEMRKGAPSQSSIVSVIIHPQQAEQEPTILTLSTNKGEYNSGEAIILSGTLTFQSDNAPLEARTIDIYKDGVKLGSATTGTDGSFTHMDLAPIVTEDTVLDYYAKFEGDPIG